MLNYIRNLRYAYEMSVCIISVKAVSHLPQVSQTFDPNIHPYITSGLCVHSAPRCNELNGSVNFLRQFRGPKVQFITCTEVFLYGCRVEGSRAIN